MEHHQPKKIFVTGGTGLIGAYTIERLVRQGHQVVALKRQSPPPFFIPPHIWQKVTWVEGDVLDVVAMVEAMQGVDAVIHSAAIVSFQSSMRRRLYKVNAEGTANVVNACIEAGVPRILHVSSVAALGRTTTGDVVDEEKRWTESGANTHYARSKHMAEMEVWRGFAEGLSGVIVNPSTVLGFGNWHQSSLTIFKNVYKGFPWYTHGVNGFVGVHDVAEAIVQLLFSEIDQERYILSSENIRFSELFSLIAKGFSKSPPTKHASPFLGSIAWRVEKVKAMLTGSQPAVTRETAMLAHTKTFFENGKIQAALPGFTFQPLQTVVAQACARYLDAVSSGLLKP